ncbi:MAG: RimK/LysX family protein [Pseudomonadota bacterium]
MSRHAAPATIGWREWVSLPDLGLATLKAKTDTGARTSALGATNIDVMELADGSRHVSFHVRPDRRRPDHIIACRAPLVDQRRVTNSGGATQMRYVVQTLAVLADHRWSIEVTLADRNDMMFPMLLGRTALAGRFVVDPGSSYVFGRHHRSDV